MSNISQYFQVTISSPKKAKKQVSIDATKYIDEGISVNDEDGLIKDCSFTMSRASLMMDILFIGMVVDIVAGDLASSRKVFNGYINSVNPEFNTDGRITLRVTALSQEGGKLGVLIRDILYPDKQNKLAWAKRTSTYSNIIKKMSQEAGLDIGEFVVKHDITASFIRPVRQNNMSDWEFMQIMASKIKCTLWSNEKDNSCFINLVDNNSLVSRIASGVTLFYLARDDNDEFSDYSKTSDKQIQLLEVKLNLDTKNKTEVIKQVSGVNSKTGEAETKIVIDKKSETGDTVRWVLNESKVSHLPREEKSKLTSLFMSGKVTWEGENGTIAARDYFTKQKIIGSSRDGIASGTEIEIAGGEQKVDGMGTSHSKKEAAPTKIYKSVLNTEELNKLPPESRSAIIGRAARFELLPEDDKYFTQVDVTPIEEKKASHKSDSGSSENLGVKRKEVKAMDTLGTRDKRDSGFTISAKIYGDPRIITKKSYVLEGLGKYSGVYYLYKVGQEWGANGWVMNLVFTK